jgi:predicted phage tail protein
MSKPPRGAGGGKSGGGGARAPTEAADSLRSIQYARVLHLVSEGEIEGPIAGAQSIYFDGTPLQNVDGSYNFAGVTANWTYGTQAQSYLPGFAEVENEVPVNTQITNASSVTRQITDPNVNAIRVTVSTPRLTSQSTTTGDLTGQAVELIIEIQANGGGYQQWLDFGISGKTTTKYQRAYRIDLTGLTPPWDIRIKRPTADSGSGALSNQTFWDSYTEIIDTKFSYPNSAIFGIEVDASQFSAFPKCGFLIRGIKVRIPDNYDPETRTYTGVWSGGFVTAWSDNPAWCFYDLLTNTRYGLGNFIDASQVDKYALYAIGQYCDEMVTDGFGGMEPRYTCNLYLQSRAEAFKVVANMASIFRGMVYWGAGTIVPVADMPSDPVALYNKSNVVDGAFSYSGSAKNTRHTVALVTWNDPEDGYTQKVEYVEDQAGIARYGVTETSFTAFGCTSRGQAHRMGKWLLYTERLEDETASFSTGLDGSTLFPGAVIKTSDSLRAGKRVGGRILSAVGTSIQVDAPVLIEVAKSYSLSAILPDGTLETRDVVTSPSTTATLTLASAYTADPQRMAIWIMAADDLEPETWRVLAVSEQEGKKGTQLGVVALAHNPGKYDAIENDVILVEPPISVLKSRPDGVTNLQLTESLFEISAGVISNRATLSWTGTTGRYRVSYLSQFGNLIYLPETPSQTIDIDGLIPGFYTFNVVQLSALGIVSPTNTLTQFIYGKTAPPADIADFTVIKSTGFAMAQWTLPPELDVKVGGFVVVRHTPSMTGAAWEDGIELQDFPGSLVQGFCPLITGTYMAKAVDSTGNWSFNAVSFVLTEGMITGFITVGTSTQSPTFPGTQTSVAVVSGGLQLDGTILIDDMLTNIDTWPMGDLGGIASSGSYAFDTYLDLLTVATRRFEADITAISFDTGDTIDVRDALMDEWDSFDGNIVNDCDVTLYASQTDDDPAVSPTWGPWVPFMVADFTDRATRFRLDFVSGQSTHNIAVSQLIVHAKIPA